MKAIEELKALVEAPDMLGAVSELLDRVQSALREVIRSSAQAEKVMKMQRGSNVMAVERGDLRKLARMEGDLAEMRSDLETVKAEMEARS